MISLVRFCTVEKICIRFYSSNNFNIAREARFLDRMIKKKISKKKTENNAPGKIKKEILESAYDNEGTTRKTAAMNKFYMEHIVEMINCGPLADRIDELGLEFTKVKITPCRSSLTVYWITNKPEIPESELLEVLRNLQKDLQAQIGFIKYMRKIPFIHFAKDLRLGGYNIVEKLLEVADFGKDYQPTSAKKVMEQDSSENLETEKKETLKMRQNVLGLDHAKIKEELMQSVKKFQAININKNELEEVNEYVNPGKLAVFSKKLFVRFYKRKLYLDKKLRTREYDDSFIHYDKNYDPEEEAEKYWEFIKFKDDTAVEEEDEIEDHENMYEDETEDHENMYEDEIEDHENMYEDNSEEDYDIADDYYKERNVDIHKDENSDKESRKAENLTEKNNKN